MVVGFPPSLSLGNFPGERPPDVRSCREIGRGKRIRTSGPCLPKAVLYQAELFPDRRISGRTRACEGAPITMPGESRKPALAGLGGHRNARSSCRSCAGIHRAASATRTPLVRRLRPVGSRHKAGMTRNHYTARAASIASILVNFSRGLPSRAAEISAASIFCQSRNVTMSTLRSRSSRSSPARPFLP